ncbi:hypothetical protein SR1949_30870 [Sphaerospermopsis reniformis]|uniref:Uncharacterized protein n=1 Tax=Sphaerospermopsis reniformis TaxID=531300 RepID=A0A480A720_9CYAN|nr:hypothetical protein [Sphaerospermopsis reniformis]GCL37974.1 hypothetical protein SR1949_30870 [Sphaerospermopsis reniformis]
MLVSEILQGLPNFLEWMVLFNLGAIRQLTDDAIAREMYHLPEDIDLAPYSHVVLTSHGRFLAAENKSWLSEPTSGQGWSPKMIKSSLAQRFSEQLSLFAVDEADCLGLGEQSPFAPVLLHIKINPEGHGEAQAIFTEQPSGKHYELLQAVGVKFLGGETKENYYLAQFRNRLPVHIHAGILSHFSRTGHCNIFFLQHGNIDPLLEGGLLKAAEVRIKFGKNRALAAVAQLATAACTDGNLAMTCQPPAPEPSFAYGDLVPLGFVLQALNLASLSDVEAERILESRQTLNQFLADNRQGKLWAFHTGRLVTATDSALILQGFKDEESIAALEIFADGEGGYYPQLWSEEEEAGKMLFDHSCRHWCQVDYATTCLIRGLQRQAWLTTNTTIDYLQAGFAQRSGLYFANPYLVDYTLACAIENDAAAEFLREQLLNEILTSMNADYSFGKYDVAFSTALAILSMARLGFRGRTLRSCQLRLLDFMEKDGKFPVCTPFYSSLAIDPKIPMKHILGLLLNHRLASGEQPQQIKKVEEEYHSISLYIDTYQMISTAVAALALAENCSPEIYDLNSWESSTANIHPRYQCSHHCEYITKFALPTYIQGT